MRPSNHTLLQEANDALQSAKWDVENVVGMFYIIWTFVIEGYHMEKQYLYHEHLTTNSIKKYFHLTLQLSLTLFQCWNDTEQSTCLL